MSTRATQFELFASGALYNGAPVVSGYAKFYAAGTTTAKNAYSDKDKSAAVTKQALDAEGRAEVYGDGLYKIRIYEGDPDTTGVLRVEIDNYKCMAVLGGVVTVTDDYTVTRDDDIVLVDTTTGDITISFDTVTSFDAPVTIKKIASANTVTLDPYTTQLIDEDTTLSMATLNQTVQLVPDTSAVIWRRTNHVATTILDITDIGLGAITIKTTGTAATYTTPTGIAYLVVTCIGGGGGSGGIDGQGAGTTAASMGGGGGGWTKKLIPYADLEETYTYTVGAGGTAGASGDNNAGAGGTTTFAGATLAMSATGGAGGLGHLGTNGSVLAAGTVSGVGSGGDINGRGVPASSRGISSGDIMGTCTSGFCPLFGGGIRSVSGADGTAGAYYGEGAGACYESNAETNRAGAAGFSGAIIIEEYYYEQ